MPLILVIEIYRHIISPLIPATCRYYPSCSNYSVEALKKHGLIRGFIIASWRVLRCNPFSIGGPDPVPPTDISLKDALNYYKRKAENG